MKRVAIVAGAMMMLLAVGMAEAQPVGQGSEGKEVKPQTVCPVMGGKINRDLFADYDGKRVYFCCEGGCADEFKKDPAKYIAKLEKDGVTLEKTPDAGKAKKQAVASGAVPAPGCNPSATKKGGCCN